MTEYKRFIASRNVLDWTIGLVLGSSIAKMVDSFVGNILLPPVTMMLGKLHLHDLFISLSGQHYATLKAAQAAGVPTINYGLFSREVLDFLIDSAVIFFVIRRVDRDHVKQDAMQECPECVMKVSIRAKTCPYCRTGLSS